MAEQLGDQERLDAAEAAILEMEGARGLEEDEVFMDEEEEEEDYHEGREYGGYNDGEVLMDGLEGLAVVEEEGEAEEEEEDEAGGGGSAKRIASFGPGKSRRGGAPTERSERRLRREKAALVSELGHAQAKFALTLQTLRAILQLGEGATWADIVEHSEALANATSGDHAAGAQSAMMLAAEELHEVELENEQLHAKLEDREQHIARLRALLQKQQTLLDMTAQQFEGQHTQIGQQAEAVTALEARSSAQEATIHARERQVTSLEEELRQHRQLGRQRDDLLRTQGMRMTELETLLASREAALEGRSRELEEVLADCENYRQQAEENATRCRQQEAEVKELEEALSQQGDLADRMNEQLQFYEAAERRRYSYATPSAEEFGTCSVGGDSALGSARLAGVLDDGEVSVGSNQAASEYSPSVSSSRPSARRSPRRAPGPHGLHGSRGSLGAPPFATQARGSLGSKGLATATAAMSEEERMKFLAHFPMASRTERNFRNAMYQRRKAMPGAGGPAEASRLHQGESPTTPV